MRIYLNHINVVAPELTNGWEELQPYILGEEKYSFTRNKNIKFKPSMLPANEARRASDAVKLAFNVCEPIQARLTDNELNYQSVFATSGGDYTIFDKICRVFAQSVRQVSPTQFHNSVLNAPAGYWSIATKNQSASTTLAAGDFTASLGLLEAATRVVANGEPVLLCAYDMCPPELIQSVRKIEMPFAVAMYLSNQNTEESLAELNLELVDVSEPYTALPDDITTLLELNPICRIVPLLHLIASKKSGEVYLPINEFQFIKVGLECLS